MKSRSLKSRVLAFLLVVCMVVGLTPVYAVSVGTSVATLQVDGTNNSDVHVTFTPTETGHYFLVNQPPLPTLSACGDHGAVPTSFDFDDDEGWGYVYELTAGQTYCFRAETTNAYSVNVKKVSVAQDFDIPATLTGYAGTTISLPINFDLDKALSTAVATSDANIVKLCGGNARCEDLELLAPGTATITLTSHTGITKTCVVTVVQPIELTIQANGVEFFVNVTSGETDWENGSSTGSMTTRFMPGKTLNDVGVTVSHDSADAPYLTGWQINGQTIVNTADLHTYVFTEDTVIEPLWTPSKYTTLRWLTIHGNGGTFERTTQDSEKIEVRQMGYDSYPTEGALATLSHTGIMNLTDPVCAGKEFEGWVAYYHGPTDTGFTNPVDGNLLTSAEVLAYTNLGVGYTDFIAKWKGEAIDPNNCPIDGTNAQISVLPILWPDDPTHNLVISSNNGSNFTLHYANASPATHSGYYGEDQRNAALTTLSAMDVTDIELDTSTQFAYWSVYIPVFDSYGNVDYWKLDTELPNKNDILTYTLGSGAMFVAEWDLSAGGNTGSPTATDQWVGNLTNHDLLKFTYTPTADGYYFIHYKDLGTRVIPELGTTEPVSDFDYHENDYEGTVFELKAGETYHFMTEDPIIGNYAIYLSPVQLATSWSIPSTLTGAVDEELWLVVTANGAMAPTYTTTNGDVVRVGGSNVNGATIFTIAAGTADIIVTDQFGNEQRCTVTVSGKLPTQTFDGWKEMGLAAGESVTYHYTPNESGLYWIYSELDYNLGINLTENGTPVNYEYAFNKADCKGKIYDLTANTTYELTFTSSVSMSTFVNAKKVEEAVTLHLDRNQREFAVGEDLHIDYLLEDRNGNAGVADITAQSSDTSVVSILSVDGEATHIQAMGAGVAEVYIVANGVTYGPVTVNVVTLGTPGGNTLPTNLIINSNNGTDFTLHTNDGSETFSCQFEGYADPALGNTLADLGLISIDLDTSTPFACWVVYRPVFDNDGNIIDWEKELDESGNDRILPNKDLILTWPINDGVMFVADWIAGGNQNGHRVEIHSSGVPYMHSVPDENGNIVSGEIGDAFGTTIASGTTLSDAGISVWQYAHNDPYFEGWLVYHQDSDGYWVEDKDSDGNFIVLDTASMLNTPITEDVRFEASWQTYSVIFEDVDGGTFDQVDPYSGETYRDDCSKAGYYVSYSYTLEEFAVITDIKNGSETFYGWDVYEEVEDPNNPGFTILNPVTGPMSMADVLSLPITYNVVFRANWTGNAPGGSGGTPGIPAPYSAGLAISGNGGTFDIVRTNPQGKTEVWEDAEHTREDMDVFIGDTLADFGITDLTDLKFWDGQREFVGWQVYGVYTVTDQWGSYEEYGPLSDKIYTTKEILAYPAEKNFIEFVAVWAGDDADYFTDVIFDALGGTFLVTAFDYTEEGPVVLGTIPMDHLWVEDCMENGQSIKEQFDSSFYPISDPVRTGYTFEGWLAFYEDQYLHEMADKLYTTEQVVNLPIPEENVQYLAKWKEIPMDEYRFGDPYFPYDGTYVQHYTVANGGELDITVHYSGGDDTYSSSYLSHHGQSSMSFLEHTKDIAGIEFDFELADDTNLEGWTTYQAERLFIIHLLEGDKLNLPANNYTAFKIDTEEYEDENGDPINLEIYMVLKNAKIYSTTMTPKEVLQLKGDTFYATMAQWHEASATLANVKAATCAAEGYTGDKVCAKCGEVLVKGEAIAKLAHTPSANLVNVKSATHTEEGYTGDVVCADCGAVIEAGKVIDKVKETVATPVVKEESKAAVDSQIQDVVAVISGEKTEETKIVLSEGTEKAIEEAVTKGDVVGADIVIEPISEENLSAEELASFKKEAAAIENTATAELGDTATVAEFIDISVIVKNRTTGEELGNITELAKPVTIEILVPAALQAENREYYIVHFHDGQAALIKGDYKDGVLTISADKFSTYALVYADVPETSDPIVPATGDQSHLVFFTTMLLLSAAGIYLASRKLRRA